VGVGGCRGVGVVVGCWWVVCFCCCGGGLCLCFFVGLVGVVVRVCVVCFDFSVFCLFSWGGWWWWGGGAWVRTRERTQPTRRNHTKQGPKKKKKWKTHNPKTLEKKTNKKNEPKSPTPPPKSAEAAYPTQVHPRVDVTAYKKPREQTTPTGDHPPQETRVCCWGGGGGGGLTWGGGWILCCGSIPGGAITPALG